MKERLLSTSIKEKLNKTLKLMQQVLSAGTIILLSKKLTNEFDIEFSIPKETINNLEFQNNLSKLIQVHFSKLTNVLFLSDFIKWKKENSGLDAIIEFPEVKSFACYPLKSGSFLCILHPDNYIYSISQKGLIDVFIENIGNQLLQGNATVDHPLAIQINSEEKFKVIFDSVPEAISFHELPSHKIITINKAFIEYSGYSEQELLGQRGRDLNLWYREDERIRYRDLLAEKGNISNFQAQFINKIGHIFHGLISSKLIQFSNQNYLLVIIRNIDQLLETQKALDDSEQKFKHVFDSLPDPISIHSYDDFSFTEVNNSFLNYTGLSRKQLIGKKAINLEMWADKDEREYFINQISKYGKINNFHFKYKSIDHEIVNGLISTETIKIGGKPHFLVATKDINDLIKVKEKLRASEEKFKMFFLSSPDAININRYEDEVFVEVNESFLKETQYTREELIGQSLFNFDFWVSASDLQYFIEQLKANNQVRNLETEFRQKDGSIISCLISASISNIDGVPHIITITRNINRLKQIQQVLEESESRFRTIVEKSHASIMIIDDLSKFIYMNPKSTELFGYSSEELLHQSFVKVLHPDSVKIVQENYRNRQLGKNPPEQYEFQIIRKDGQVRDVEIRSSVFIDKNKNIRTISQLLDITDIKKAILNAKQLEEKAQNYLDVAAVMMLALNDKGEVIMINKKACDILEYTEEEIIGKNWFDHFLPKGRRTYTKGIFNKIFNGRKLVQYSESLILTKNQNEKTIAWHNTSLKNIEGEIIGILSSGEDISEKLESIDLIKENEERYRTLFEANLDGMLIFNLDGKIIEANQLICQMYGYSYDEFINRENTNKLNIVSTYDI
ncbi:MAG: PAS domain S-box protein, partial [Bacteroidales bacterium]|nr:PAS domain S-box protein [Bacteroidales bacterium]